MREQLITSLSFGLFIFLFLLFFQPFGLGDMNTGKSLYILGFGLITSLTMILNFRLGPLLSPGFFDEDAWTIKREILIGLWNIFLITLLNYVYSAFAGGKAIHPRSIFIFMIITVSIGSFPLTILVFVRELYLNDRQQKVASKLSLQIQAATAKNRQLTLSMVVIRGSTGNESLEVNESDLLFIKSSDNYCLVNFLKDGEPSSQLLRVTLKDIETQLNHHPNIFRCHRSYLLNKQKIARLTGNARAYTIHLIGSDEVIPVSRGIKKESFFIE